MLLALHYREKNTLNLVQSRPKVGARIPPFCTELTGVLTILSDGFLNTSFIFDCVASPLLHADGERELFFVVKVVCGLLIAVVALAMEYELQATRFNSCGVKTKSLWGDLRGLRLKPASAAVDLYYCNDGSTENSLKNNRSCLMMVGLHGFPAIHFMARETESLVNTYEFSEGKKKKQAA